MREKGPLHNNIISNCLKKVQEKFMLTDELIENGKIKLI